MVLTVHSVIDGDKADAHLREPNFRIKSYLQIIPAKPGHILHHNHADKSGLNIPQHFLESGTLEAGAGVAVIFVNLVVRNTVIPGILGEDFDLMGNAVAVPFVLVIAGEADIEGHPFLNQRLQDRHYRPPPNSAAMGSARGIGRSGVICSLTECRLT